MAAYANIHGRRTTRGVRPWLIVPKVICVAAYFGGVAAMLVVAVALPHETPEQASRLGSVCEALGLYLVIPAAIMVDVLGVLLLLQHPRVFISRRWLQVKLVLLIVAAPVLGYMAHGAIEAQARGRLIAVLAAALVMLAAIIALGRQKPRLGQRVTTVAQQRSEE